MAGGNFHLHFIWCGCKTKHDVHKFTTPNTTVCKKSWNPRKPATYIQANILIKINVHVIDRTVRTDKSQAASGCGERHCESKVSYSRTQQNVSGARFSKAPGTFRACKAIYFFFSFFFTLAPKTGWVVRIPVDVLTAANRPAMDPSWQAQDRNQWRTTVDDLCSI